MMNIIEGPVSEETTGELIELLVSLDSLPVEKAITNIENLLDKGERDVMTEPLWEPSDLLNKGTHKYERWGTDPGSEWEELTTREEQDKMVNTLGNAYINVIDIMLAMHSGLEARTPFATYRAFPIDED